MQRGRGSLSFRISEFFQPGHDFLLRLALILLRCRAFHFQRLSHLRLRRVGKIVVGAGMAAALVGAEGGDSLAFELCLVKESIAS